MSASENHNQESVEKPNPSVRSENQRNGGLFAGDDDDIFKSAIESPMTDGDQTVLGHDEINLDDDDEDDSMEGMGIVHQTSRLNDETKEMDDDSLHNGSTKGVENTKRSEESKPYQDEQEDQGSIPAQQTTTTIPTTTTTTSTSLGCNGRELLAEIKLDLSSSDSVSVECALNESDDYDRCAVSDLYDLVLGEGEEETEGQYIEITVTEPQKQGDGMSGFIVYRVTTRTNIALFRRKEFAVWRRFSDFLGLHNKLSEKYLRKGRIVPPAPEKNIFGTTKVKISGQGDPSTSSQSAGASAHHSEFLDRRRAGLERFMNRIAAHPVLRLDCDFKDFLEIDTDLPKATSTSAFSGAGVVRLFSKFGETVNKISYKMDESDPWFEEKIQNIEALEVQLRKVHASIELLVVNRKELAVSTGSFAKSAAILSNAEEHTALARALAQLSEVEEKVEQVHQDQANSDFFLFSELLKDYIALIGSVKDVFHERVKAYQNWQHAQQTLNKKREIKAKLELQVRTDKIPQAREEVVEWESKVERGQEDFNTMSGVIKKELELFEVTRVKEFKKIIVMYLESLLSHQTELVKHWEAFLPEAKAIV